MFGYMGGKLTVALLVVELSILGQGHVHETIIELRPIIFVTTSWILGPKKYFPYDMGGHYAMTSFYMCRVQVMTIMMVHQ